MKYKKTIVPCKMCGAEIDGDEISNGGAAIMIDYRSKDGSTLSIQTFCKDCAPKVEEAFVAFTKAIGAYSEMAEEDDPE